MKRMTCPDCGKKGVTLRLGREDFYGCRYCTFFAYTGGYDTLDVNNRVRLSELNPTEAIHA